jgi:hypothetical protein
LRISAIAIKDSRRSHDDVEEGLLAPEPLEEDARPDPLAGRVASRTEAKAWIAARRVRVNVFEIVLSEGRNREVRRMVEALGSKVLKLVRTRIGPIRIGDLPIGSCRPLSPAEIRSLQKSGKGSSLGRDKRST